VKKEMKDIEILLDQEDTALFKSAGDYFRGKLDLDEVRNDPALEAVRTDVSKMVSGYFANTKKLQNNKEFIRASMGLHVADEPDASEMKDIRFEIHRSNVNDLTAEWVKEWHENRKKSAAGEKKSKEIREFIMSSLDPGKVVTEKSDAETDQIPGNNKGIRRSLLIRYIALSAAAVLGVFLLIRTLLPSYNPDKLFSAYYSPFEMVTSVTRASTPGMNAGPIEGDKFSVAVQKYRSGDYISAKALFAELLSADPSTVAPRFLMGLSCLALNEFDNAVVHLEKISESTGAYRKEANWYLGLAYLKTGDKEKAAKNLELLVQSPGYYTDRSRELLRHIR
jgi:TolA-binding protein